MKLADAKRLCPGDEVRGTRFTNRDGTPYRYKVTSVKTWKREPNRVLVKLKRGLRQFDEVTESQLHEIEPSGPIYKPVYKPGQRVKYTFNERVPHFGKCGTVISDACGMVTVQFDDEPHPSLYGTRPMGRYVETDEAGNEVEVPYQRPLVPAPECGRRPPPRRRQKPVL